ncbi:MAG TPA: hypothetical protein VFH78_06510 [Candidatus Thermoplasmatota archaeon]|nr:hypothetical protein [Candidatus Thermoplasmatota archaeon]
MRLVGLLALTLLVAPAIALPAPAPAEWEARAGQPVVLLGAQLPGLAVVARYVERPPLPFQEEAIDGAWLPLPALPVEGATPVDEVAVFRWEGGAFVRVVSQVDERFVRYLTNYASDFAPYSQSDMELTYAFDAEGARKTGEAPGEPWRAAFAGAATTPDPVPGFDSDDELVFLAGDAGARAPAHAGLLEVELLDPLTGARRYAYVGRAAPVAFEPLVTYARDADADLYVQSNHGGYGGAPGGTCFPGDGVDAPWGTPRACDHRRPKDSAWVTAQTYRFHYAGRWKLDAIHAREGDGWGPDLVDRWKGRAFQQREGNALDIGGFEDENDWTRSSVTLGERVGPIRVLRETWGADSGTHVTRLDAFYPTFFSQVYRLRVHPVPPDGIYAFWDHTAGAVDTYYTAYRPEGVPIDGVNDEAYGTNSEWQEDALGATYFAIDAPDPTLQGPLANVAWDQVSGARGSVVTVLLAPDTKTGALTPYYRDDALFNDGTGHDPQPQGSFGAHGIHFFFTSDSDNLFLPAPVTEFVAEVRMLVREGRLPNVAQEHAAREIVPLTVAVR